MNAYILCGGASRRMGRPKVMLPFQGKPMGVHIANLAEDAGFSPFFIAKGSQNFELPFPILVDQITKRHPISGILRAMEHCSEEYFLLLPCDTPFLSSASLSQFLKNPVRSIAYNQRPHPLIGLYSTMDLEQAQDALEDNISMKIFSENFSTVSLPLEELHNCNHPEDL
jgi:molybdopterin-guanine dinucleotide biosynthesis protein A